MRKSILLFLALLLPITIFLFLHFFGNNEFEVPVFYQTATVVPASCNMEYNFPYKVQSAKVPLSGITVILFFSGMSTEALNEAVFQLNRLQAEFGALTPQIIMIRKIEEPSFQMDNEVLLGNDDYLKEQRCVYLAEPNKIVLVDGEKQIRGLYADASLKEIDRLILELKIIFKQY